MKKVYLIRHGKPAFPEGKRMCLGRTDLPLCEEGFVQARRAAESLSGREFQMFSSPLLRARQTAAAFQRPVTVLEDLQELYAGAWDGLSFDIIETRYPELYKARASDKTIPLPGAEDNASGLLRFRKAMCQAAEQADGDFAVVSHGGVTGLFLQELTGHWQKPGYCEIVNLSYDNGIFKLL